MNKSNIMATRSYIKISDLQGLKLYKHYDGDPKSTLPWLKSFNTKWAETGREDNNYKFAQLVRSSVIDAEEFNLDTSTETGWALNIWKTNTLMAATYIFYMPTVL